MKGLESGAQMCLTSRISEMFATLNWSTIKRAAAPLVLAASLLVPSVASADMRDFVFVNASGHDVDYLYVVAAESAAWGEDILGTEYLPAGEQALIVFNNFVPGGCLYDIQAATLNGSIFEAYKFDLCSTVRVEFRADEAEVPFYYFEG
jgi:hypothetical protein